MEQNSSIYEDAHSKGSNSEINNDNFNNKGDRYLYGKEKSNNYKKLKQNNFDDNYNNNINGELYNHENKRYNNISEINMNNNNNGSNLNSNYLTPRQSETKFEIENKGSFCSNCKCLIF